MHNPTQAALAVRPKTQLLTSAGVIRHLAISRETLRRIVDRGHLRRVKLPTGGLRYRLSDVERIAAGAMT